MLARQDEGVHDQRRTERFSFPVTRVLFEHRVADGLVLRQYRLVPGGSAPCTVAPEEHFGITWLIGDLSQADRVDVELIDEPSSRVLVRIEDAPFDRASGEVGIAAAADFLRTLP